MRPKTIFLLLFVCISTILFAQNSNRKFVGFTSNNFFVKIQTNDGWYRIQPYSNQIIEASFIPKNETYNPYSEAVVLKPKHASFKIVENEQNITISTKGIKAVITKTPFQISYYYHNKEVISERKGYEKQLGEEVLDFNLTPNEVLYGGGERALGMNRRGYKLRLYNKADYGYQTHSELMNFTMPLVFSSKMYAVHFDNAPIGYLNLDSAKDNSLRYETISGRKTYQVIVGNTWEDLVEQYTNLTGKQPMIPRWALGNFSSRFGYHSQNEVLKTIDKFLTDSIPVDAVVLDLYWFGKKIKGTMGNLAFYKDSFPDPKKMIRQLKQKGVKTILITEPFILTTSKRWKEAVDMDILAKTKEGKPYTYDFYFGNTGLIDIFKPSAQKWFWNIYKNLAKEYGVSGWWGDLGEPEVHPEGLIHVNGTANELHNIYGHNWAKVIDKAYQKDFPNQRPFILMRAGYAGSQHYGMIPWSGDVSRSWGGFQSQPEIALQMGMQGMGFAHSDLGGFAGANLDDELYVRWLQYGVFNPIFRPHAQEQVASEPVFRESKTKYLAKKAIELRYQLLPYNYTLAFKNNQHGTPLMRPLFFDEPNNGLLQTYSTTYLWGTDFLISPVMRAGIKEQEVYFPKKSNWFNYYTDEKNNGGQTKMVQLNINSIPTYVRGGAFIPRIKTIQNTDSYNLTSFDLHFYFDNSIKNSNGMLYNDDGLTRNAYENGMFEVLNFKSKYNRNRLRIKISDKVGKNYNFQPKNINLIIHNVTKIPKKVKGYSYNFNEHKHILIIKVKLYKPSKDIQIKF
jgi:alpha-glucosidase (family GH31 glycosyl hydrolase)